VTIEKDRTIADTRILSHLLHPPLLDESGFVSADKGTRGTLEIESNFEGTLLQSTIPASSPDELQTDDGSLDSLLRPNWI